MTKYDLLLDIEIKDTKKQEVKSKNKKDRC